MGVARIDRHFRTDFDGIVPKLFYEFHMLIFRVVRSNCIPLFD